MSAYDDAVAYLDAEVHPRCDYDIYSDMRDIVDEMEAENAKLRKLVRKYVEYTSQDRCDGCVVKSRCNDGEVDECWQLTEIRGLARELEIEVDAC